MEINKIKYQKKWEFLDKRPYKPGLIIDGENDIELWMNYSPEEIVQNRINQDLIEDSIFEFVEMFWSIEPDYRVLEMVFKKDFTYLMNEKYVMVNTDGTDKNKIAIPKIKEIHMTLDPETEYIQTFELVLYEIPDINILNEKVKQLSSNLVFEHKNNKLKLMVSGKSFIISN
ncbi:hypothetical protein PQ460_22590 [Paenibacillus sp. KACC 21273]|uniref:hypothetical protein n=1 Tax=Paenibacillus sp. KACC 21273 TaxID=3025665 RepID=UPI002366BA8A|nr:hypothetical protein [Paenibacillus sp. KACC 21273]WDF50725.1 hypothetical protein PQ460_22590 [Paenibacillus sp. KACC 21273]